MPEGPPPCACVLCHDYGDRDRLDNFLLRTMVHITQFGWSVVLNHPDDIGPGWAYTIGLWHSHRAPELAMFGGDVYEMEESLGTLGRQAAGGDPPVEGGRRDGIAWDRTAGFRTVDRRWYEALLPGAARFYRRTPPPFLQVLWPNADGLFPWQPGTDLPFRRSQPWLWLAPGRHSPGAWTRRL